MEGAPCTWLWREMPPSAPGMRPRVARTTHGLSTREAGACSSGEGEALPGGDRAAGLAPAGGGGGRLRAGYGWHAGSPAARGAAAPPPTSGGDSHPRRRQVAAYRLLLAGGRVLPWSPTAGRGSRDRETRGPRVEAGTVGPRAWSPCRGRRTSGSLQRHGLRGPRLPEAAARGDAPAGAPGGLRSRGPSGRSAPGSGRSPGAASRRAAVGLPRGPGSTSRSRGGGQGWAASGCARGAPRPRVTQPRPPPGAGTRPGPAVGS